MSDASDIARAVAAGLDPTAGALLAALRRRWWKDNLLDAAFDPHMGISNACWPDLDRILASPSSPAFDEVFVAALRRRRDLTLEVRAEVH